MKISKLGDKTIKEIVKEIYGDELGQQLIDEIQSGVENKEEDDEIMNRLIKAIAPDLQKDKIMKIYNLFRIRPITIHGVPPPTE